MQASAPSAVTRELVNGISRPVEQGPPARADVEASKHGKSDEDSVGRDHFNDLQSLHGDTVSHLRTTLVSHAKNGTESG